MMLYFALIKFDLIKIAKLQSSIRFFARFITSRYWIRDKNILLVDVYLMRYRIFVINPARLKKRIEKRILFLLKNMRYRI